MLVRTRALSNTVFNACRRTIHASRVRYGGDIISQHRDTPDNTTSIHFDFTVENYKKVETIMSRYPMRYKKSAVIPLLDLGQRQNGNFCTVAVMDKVASILEMPNIDVYEVATFYTMFNRTKVGKYFIQLCGTTPCMVCGSEEIKNTICEHLDIGDGGTSADGMFSLLEVECLGACVNAPMVQINDDFYECLTPETTRQLLDRLIKDGPMPMTYYGSRPLNGQYSCEGPLGATTLTSPPPGVERFTRELPNNVDPAEVGKQMNYQ